jgi:hypothetical protein
MQETNANSSLPGHPAWTKLLNRCRYLPTLPEAFADCTGDCKNLG